MTKKQHALCGAAIVALIACNQAYAQTQPTDTAPSESETVVVVTGFKKSYANALKSKRSNVDISDSISSDGLGRFPDLNVGEAVQRIPGVQIDRSGEGREARVNLRGMPSEYARLTLNGVAFAEPVIDTGTPLGAFNSDIFSAISVVKSSSASNQSGGLSGIIDLQVARASERKDGGFTKVAYEYNELGGLGSPSYSLGYNKKLTDKLSVFATVAYKRENFRRDSVIFNGWTKLSAHPNTTNLSAFAAQGTDNVAYAGQIRQYVRENEGDLLSLAAGADYKVNDQFKIGFTSFYTDRDKSGDVQHLQIEDFRAPEIQITVDPASLQKLSDGSYIANSFSFKNSDHTVSTRNLPQHPKTWGWNGYADWKNEKWRLATNVTLSEASNSSLETEFDANNTHAGPSNANKSPSFGVDNGVSGSLQLGHGDIEGLKFAVNAPPMTYCGNYVYDGAKDAEALYDPNCLTERFSLTGSLNYATNKLTAVQQDFEHYFDDSLFTSVQFGARYENVEFIAKGYRTSSAGLKIQNITSALFTPAGVANDFFGGNLAGFNRDWQDIDVEKGLTVLTPVTLNPAPGAFLSPQGLNINFSKDENYNGANFTNENEIQAVYIMGKYATTLAGVPVRGNIGARYESTENTVTALNTKGSNPNDYFTQTFKNKYSQFLPSAILIADLSDNLVARAAAYKTYVRPQPRQFSPTTTISNNNASYDITLGNPALEPYTANSYDLSLEWYNRPNGIISLALFRKDIQGIIQDQTDLNVLCPANGSSFGIGTLSRDSSGQCISNSLVYNGLPVEVNITSKVNSPSDLKVSGAELNIQQNLDFLPAPFDKLGGGVNYAYTTISGEVSPGVKASLPGVSENNLNLIAYYETSKYGVRLTYNYRDEFGLASTGTFNGEARIVKARGQLDISASYSFTPTVTLSFDAFNVTDEEVYYYEIDEARTRRVDYDGRTYQLTVRATF